MKEDSEKFLVERERERGGEGRGGEMCDVVRRIGMDGFWLREVVGDWVIR